MKNRILSLVLAFLCIITAIPVTSLSVSAAATEYSRRVLLPDDNYNDDKVNFISKFEPPYGDGTGENYTLKGLEIKNTEFLGETAVSYQKTGDKITAERAEGEPLVKYDYQLNLYSYNQEVDSNGKTVRMYDTQYITVEYYYDISARDMTDEFGQQYEAHYEKNANNKDVLVQTNMAFQLNDYYSNGTKTNSYKSITSKEPIVSGGEGWNKAVFDVRAGLNNDSLFDVANADSYVLGQWMLYPLGTGKGSQMYKGDVLYIKSITFTSYDPANAPNKSRDVVFYLTHNDYIYDSTEAGRVYRYEDMHDLDSFVIPDPNDAQYGFEIDGLKFSHWMRVDYGTTHYPGEVFELIDGDSAYFSGVYLASKNIAFNYPSDVIYVEDVSIGDEIDIPALPSDAIVPDGYKFLGWKNNTDGQIYAPGTKYVVKDLRLAFDAELLAPTVITFNYGDSKSFTATVYKGFDFVIPELPADASVGDTKFAGWKVGNSTYAAGSNINYDGSFTTVDAVYVAPTTLTFNYGDGVSFTVAAHKGFEFVVPGLPADAVIPDGAEFIGWKARVTTYKPGETIIYDGSYTELDPVYVGATVITFNYGQDMSFELDVHKGFDFVIPELPADAVIPAESRFGGWKIGKNTYKAGDVVNYDGSFTTAEAVYVEPTTITFTYGDKSFEDKAYISLGYKFPELPDNSVIPEGKVFVGWKDNGAVYYECAEYVFTGKDMEFVPVYADRGSYNFDYKAKYPVGENAVSGFEPPYGGGNGDNYTLNGLSQTVTTFDGVDVRAFEKTGDKITATRSSVDPTTKEDYTLNLYGYNYEFDSNGNMLYAYDSSYITVEYYYDTTGRDVNDPNGAELEGNTMVYSQDNLYINGVHEWAGIKAESAPIVANSWQKAVFVMKDGSGAGNYYKPENAANYPLGSFKLYLFGNNKGQQMYKGDKFYVKSIIYTTYDPGTVPGGERNAAVYLAADSTEAVYTYEGLKDLDYIKLPVVINPGETVEKTQDNIYIDLDDYPELSHLKFSHWIRADYDTTHASGEEFALVDLDDAKFYMSLSPAQEVKFTYGDQKTIIRNWFKNDNVAMPSLPADAEIPEGKVFLGWTSGGETYYAGATYKFDGSEEFTPVYADLGEYNFDFKAKYADGDNAITGFEPPYGGGNGDNYTLNGLSQTVTTFDGVDVRAFEKTGDKITATRSSVDPTTKEDYSLNLFGYNHQYDSEGNMLYAYDSSYITVEYYYDTTGRDVSDPNGAELEGNKMVYSQDNLYIDGNHSWVGIKAESAPIVANSWQKAVFAMKDSASAGNYYKPENATNYPLGSFKLYLFGNNEGQQMYKGDKFYVKSIIYTTYDPRTAPSADRVASMYLNEDSTEPLYTYEGLKDLGSFKLPIVISRGETVVKTEGNVYVDLNEIPESEGLKFGGWIRIGDNTKHKSGERIKLTDLDNPKFYMLLSSPSSVEFVYGEGKSFTNNWFTGDEVTMPELPADAEIGTSKFAGWKVNGVTYKAGEKIEYDGTFESLEAVYIPATTVTFTYGEGKSFDCAAYNGFDLVMPALPADAEMPEGKAFIGWKSGDNTYSAGKTLTFDGTTVSFTAVFGDPVPVYYSASGSISGVSDKVYTSLAEADAAIAEAGGIGIIKVSGTIRFDASSDYQEENYEFSSKNITIESYGDTTAVAEFNAKGNVAFTSSVGTKLTFKNIKIKRLTGLTDEFYVAAKNVDLVFGSDCTFESQGSHLLYIGNGINNTVTIDGDLEIAVVSPLFGWSDSSHYAEGNTNFVINGGTVNSLYLTCVNGNWSGSPSTFKGNVDVEINGGTIGNLVLGGKRADILNGNAIVTVNGGNISTIAYGDEDVYQYASTGSISNLALVYNVKEILGNNSSVPQITKTSNSGNVGNSVLVINNKELITDTVPSVDGVKYTVHVMGGKATPVFDGSGVLFKITPDNENASVVLANGNNITANQDGLYTFAEGTTVVGFAFDVTFNYDGKSFNKSWATGDTVELPALPDDAIVPDGKKFVGWKNNETGTIHNCDNTIVYDGSTTSFDVVYMATTEVAFTYGEKSLTYDWYEGESVTIPALPADAEIPDGKVFIGWKSGDNTYSAGKTLTFDGTTVSFTAVFGDPVPVYYSASGSISGVSDKVYTSLAEADAAIAEAGGIGIIKVSGTIRFDASSDWQEENYAFSSKNITIESYGDTTAVAEFNAKGNVAFTSSVGTKLTFKNIKIKRLTGLTDEFYVAAKNVDLVFGSDCTFESQGSHLLYIGNGVNNTVTIDGDLKIAVVVPLFGWSSGSHYAEGNTKFIVNGGTVNSFYLTCVNGNWSGSPSTFKGNVDVEINGGTVNNLVLGGKRADILNGNAIVTINGGNVANVTYGNGDAYQSASTGSIKNLALVYNVKEILANNSVVPQITKSSNTNSVGNSVLVINNKELITGTVPSIDVAKYTVHVIGGKATPVFDDTKVYFEVVADNQEGTTMFVNGKAVEESASGRYEFDAGITEIQFKSNDSLVTVKFDNGDEDTVLAGALYALPKTAEDDGANIFYGWKVDNKFYKPGSHITLPSEGGAVVNVETCYINDETVIYFDAESGNDANDGLTETTAIKTVGGLNELLKRFTNGKATVQIIGTYTNPDTYDYVELPSYDGVLTLQGGTISWTNYRGWSAHVNVNSDIIFKGIAFYTDRDSQHINFNGYDVTFEENVTKASGCAGIYVHTGKEDNDMSEDQKIVLKSCQIEKLHIGPYYNTAAKTYSGKFELVVDGATVNSVVYGDSWSSGTSGKFAISGDQAFTFKSGSVGSVDISSELISSADVNFVIFNYTNSDVVCTNDRGFSLYTFNVNGDVEASFNDGKLITDKVARVIGSNTDIEGKTEFTGLAVGEYDIICREMSFVGAQIRTDSELPAALRFIFKVEGASYAAKSDYGMLVYPSAMLGDNTLTHALVAEGAAKDVAVNKIFDSDATSFSFSVAITKIKNTAEGYNTKFTVVPYIKNADGTYTYGTAVECSLYDVAKEAIDKGSTDEYFQKIVTTVESAS